LPRAGPCDLDRRVLVDAEVERRVLHHTEPATGLADLEDGDAVNRQFLVDFRAGAAGVVPPLACR
jgi:hypothetical protein